MALTNRIRFWAAGQREMIAMLHANHGNQIGYDATKRFIWEYATFITELQGTEMAAEMLYSIADAVIGGKVPGDMAMPGLLKMDGKGSAAIVAGETNMQSEVQTRIQETKEWLKKNAPEAARTFVHNGRDAIAWRVGYLACLNDIAGVGAAEPPPELQK